MKKTIEEKFRAVTNASSSYSTYPKNSNVKEYCISSNEWLYQANLTEGEYNLCIKKSGIRHEYPSKIFNTLEEIYFKELF